MIPTDELKGKIKSVIEISYKAVNCDSGEVKKGGKGWKNPNHKDSQQKYDVNKNMVEKNRYNPDGSLDYQWTYKYDDVGNMVEEANFPDGSLLAKYAYKYDESKNMVEENNYDGAGVLFDRYSYKYDGEYLIEEINYDLEGGLNSKSTYKYDGNGNMIEKNEYNSKGKLSNTSTYSFDSRDNIIKEGGHTLAQADVPTYMIKKEKSLKRADTIVIISCVKFSNIEKIPLKGY